jgi:hypothetical protein
MGTLKISLTAGQSAGGILEKSLANGARQYLGHPELLYLAMYAGGLVFAHYLVGAISELNEVCGKTLQKPQPLKVSTEC